MATTLIWRTGFSTSCLHAAEAHCRGQTLADERLAAAIAEPAAALGSAIQSAGLPAERFWQCLVALSASIESNRELASTAIIKVVGRGRTFDAAEASLAGAISGVEAAVRVAFPQMPDELPLRIGPIREQWEARGPGLLRTLALLTDGILLSEQAEVIVVHPALGGAGDAYLPGNQVRIEGVLANPRQELPEVVRLGWLLAQLQLDLPAISEGLHPERLPAIARLAMLPPVLRAAEEVELCRMSPQLYGTALTAWRIDAPAGSEAVPVLMQWWETYLADRPPWRVALAALDQMLE